MSKKLVSAAPSAQAPQDAGIDEILRIVAHATQDALGDAGPFCLHASTLSAGVRSVTDRFEVQLTKIPVAVTEAAIMEQIRIGDELVAALQRQRRLLLVRLCHIAVTTIARQLLADSRTEREEAIQALINTVTQLLSDLERPETEITDAISMMEADLWGPYVCRTA